jgi:predicted alpha/beta-fold hydrolase
MRAIGVSLGANQLLRAVGRIGAGIDTTPAWFDRLQRIAAVAPPLDLQRCSDNMERWILRPYNYYFIRALLARAPARVRQRDDFQQSVLAGRPKTLRELDDRITAPLSGFADAAEYYTRSSATSVTLHNPVRTLVLAAADDPIVPIGCFVDDKHQWPDSTSLVVSKTGGHVGFIDRRKRSWMDRVMEAWFSL